MKKLLSAILALTLTLALAPMALAEKDDNDVAYPVEGGNIYIDEATHTVTGADQSITAAVIPDTVTAIGDNAFDGCVDLLEVEIPDSVTSIGVGAFAYSGVESVTVPGSVKTVGDRAFAYGLYLTEVRFQDGVTTLGDRLFCYSYELTTVYIPASVTSIGAEALETYGGGSLHYDSTLNEWVATGVDVYYGGTEEQWAAIDGVDNLSFSEEDFTVHYNNATAPSAPGFTDVDAAYTDAVKWATDNKFADAESDTAFGAEKPCPRWEVVSILWRAMGSTEPTISSVPFTDVSPDAPYYKAVCWAYENEIALGDTATTFGPENTVERGQAITFIHRAAGNPATSAANTFNDVKDGDYFYAPVLWGAEKGIVYGTDVGVFSPASPVTRAQMVTFLYRWAGK